MKHTQETVAGFEGNMLKVVPYKQQVQECIIQLYTEVGKDKEKLVKAVSMVQKFQKNIIENPNEPKFRQIKQQNPKIYEAITKYYNGIHLLKLVGFQEFYDPENKETVLKIPPTVSTSYMKGQKLDFDSVVNKYY